MLRELVEAIDVSRIADLARLTGADPTALRRALAPLVASGLVGQVGQGRGAVFRIERGHILSGALENLFAVERSRRQAIPEVAREWAESSAPAPIAIWLYGSVPRGEDDFASDVDLALIAPEPVTATSKRAREADPDRARAQVDSLSQSFFRHLQREANQWHLSPSLLALLPSELLALEQDNPALWDGLVNHSRPIVGPAATVLVNRLKRQRARA
jgi:predicted nucleotidyltransferase